MGPMSWVCLWYCSGWFLYIDKFLVLQSFSKQKLQDCAMYMWQNPVLCTHARQCYGINFMKHSYIYGVRDSFFYTMYDCKHPKPCDRSGAPRPSVAVV